jgi:hypothetical protein
MKSAKKEGIMLKRLHPVAAAVALLTIALFWGATLVSELSGAVAWIVRVKTLIPWGVVLLIPALAGTALSGRALAKTRRGPVLERKKKRMPLIVANGLAVLVPSALYLSFKAQAQAFDMGFYLVQALELLAGGLNITLLGLSFRDGLRLSGKLPPRR